MNSTTRIKFQNLAAALVALLVSLATAPTFGATPGAKTTSPRNQTQQTITPSIKDLASFASGSPVAGPEEKVRIVPAETLKLARSGPRDSGGGNLSLLEFKSLLQRIPVFLHAHRADLDHAVPRRLDFDHLPTIQLAPGKRLKKNGKPVLALNYKKDRLIQLDVDQWKLYTTGKKKAAMFGALSNDTQIAAAKIALAYHEWLEVLGGFDDDQQYTYSVRLYSGLLAKPNLLVSFYQFLATSQMLETPPGLMNCHSVALEVFLQTSGCLYCEPNGNMDFEIDSFRRVSDHQAEPLVYELKYSYTDDDGMSGTETEQIEVFAKETRGAIPLCDFFEELRRREKAGDK